MMPKDHHKTRTGCKQCKSRRVKCDEKRPLCSACIRNRLPCSLEFLTPVFPSTITRKSNQSIKTSLIEIPPSISQQDSNFELMDHYTTIACSTLIQNSRHTDIWQVDIPNMALSHPFLLHGILGFSALHLSTLQPSRKRELLQRASIFEQIALTPFRKFVSTNDPRNIHAVFAFAGFVIPYVIAQPGILDVPYDRIPCLDDQRPHWFLMLRGLTSLLERSWADLAKGPFNPLLSRPVRIEYDWNPGDPHLARISEILEPTGYSSADDKRSLAICQRTLHILRRVSAVPFLPSKTLNALAAVYIWPGAVEQGFIELLHARRPEALVILAHYCVLLKNVDSCWYLKGVGTKMLVTIDKELDLAWKPWIRWALDQPVRMLDG